MSVVPARDEAFSFSNLYKEVDFTTATGEGIFLGLMLRETNLLIRLF